MTTGVSSRTLSVFLVAAAATMLLAMSTAALASQHGAGAHHGKSKGHKMPTFAEVDLDGDGAIIAEEFYEFRGKRMAERAKAGGKMKNAANAPTFESIDLDDNGEVSSEEFATHQAEMRKKHQDRKEKTST
ncbi:MAG: EF-hand domain-containing protein [Gammaproteobacteria bacterium]|nr:EF-hand domain-containing protein [Gammaproteobacteria bacterium]